ncbi:MAG: ParB/RepB/Spo0J family partition protein [Proteobacteria bacterium]|nr:ParB/RepB/Spo0J family partition protein [Pseudomonadota bacterium]
MKNPDSHKKQPKKALGKGLGALLPDIDTFNNASSDYFLCDINIINPNRYQPRMKFSEQELNELAESIKEQGIIQPLLVRTDDTGYELIAGERRLRAAKMAGLDKIPVVVKNISDTELLEMAIVENIQRENFTPMEEAEAYHRLLNEFKLTQEEVAKRVGKSRSAVANFMRLRHLPEPIKASISDGTLSMGHARALLGAENPAQQNAAWKTILAKGLSVRKTESLVKQLKSEKIIPEKKPSVSDNYFKDISDGLSRRFGTKVHIARKGKKGKISIDFYGDDDLNRLFQMLNGEP